MKASLRTAFAASIVACVTACSSNSTPASSPSVENALHADLQSYLTSYGTSEHISAASLSVSLANRETIDVAAGTTVYNGSMATTPANLFQIGSNTKAFTGVLAEHLQTAGKLKVSQTIGDWLPQYPRWRNASITQMLNMTSGIISYDGDAWGAAYSRNPYHFFSTKELIAFAYPRAPKKHVWLYSNTGYLLTEEIEKRAGGGSYTEQMRGIIAGTGIDDLYYYPGIYPKSVQARSVAGYFDNTGKGNEMLAPLLKKDVRPYSMSWAQAAGAIVATPHAVALWDRDLYQGDVVTPAERAQMERLVSTETGDPIEHVTKSDPRGFGLGVSQAYFPGLGRVWFYEGITLGYRVLHAYFPNEDVVFVVGVNSQPTEDHIGELVGSVVGTLKKYHLF
jgi:D-alanyl-D-alanine carboxypeptidase